MSSLILLLLYSGGTDSLALAPALALSVFVRSRIGNTSRVVRAIGGVTDRSNLLPLAGATRITEHRDTRHRFSQRLVSRRAPLRLGTQAWRGPLTACLAAAQAARALGALRAHALVLGPGPHPGSGHSGRTALLLAASREPSQRSPASMHALGRMLPSFISTRPSGSTCRGKDYG